MNGWQASAVAVCVPARDEAALLPRLLAGLAAQRPAAGVGRFVCCFLLDGPCPDSEAILKAAQPFELNVKVFPRSPEPDAGAARARAMAMGTAALAGEPAAALLTTDADSVPAPDWIAQTCRALSLADVVAGRIARDDAAHPAQDRIEAYYDRLYTLRRRIDPVAWEDAPAHHQTGGASLAFRADAYRALGGFAPRAAGEDAAIVDAARRAGLSVRHDCAVRVTTSARHHGRAQGGMADHLRALDRDELALVAHPAGATWQYRGHAAARAAWPDITASAVTQRLAEQLEIDPAAVARTAALSSNAEAFAMQVVPAAPGGERLVSLSEAERALASIDQPRSCAA